MRQTTDEQRPGAESLRSVGHVRFIFWLLFSDEFGEICQQSEFQHSNDRQFFIDVIFWYDIVD